jgi:L-fucose isomerase-like protein
MPQSFATEWILKPKVLEIVDDNATMVDARMPEGDITLAKLHPKLNKIQVIEGELEEYKQYPGSDCRNGALIRISDGHKLMDELYSHHNCITSGHKGVELKFMARALDLGVDEI